MTAGFKDLEKEILREHSKRQTVALARWVGHDDARFGQLMSSFLRGDRLVTQRAAWIVDECVERNPVLARPWLRQMLRKMQEPDVHIAVPRNVMRILQMVEIPKSLQGEVVTLCFDYLMNPSTPVSIAAYSMEILFKISQEEPDLRREVRAVIEQLLPAKAGGINARARMVLKALAHAERGKP